jgi:hypothetical protein
MAATTPPVLSPPPPATTPVVAPPASGPGPASVPPPSATTTPASAAAAAVAPLSAADLAASTLLAMAPPTSAAGETKTAVDITVHVDPPTIGKLHKRPDGVLGTLQPAVGAALIVLEGLPLLCMLRLASIVVCIVMAFISGLKGPGATPWTITILTLSNLILFVCTSNVLEVLVHRQIAKRIPQYAVHGVRYFINVIGCIVAFTAIVIGVYVVDVRELAAWELCAHVLLLWLLYDRAGREVRAQVMSREELLGPHWTTTAMKRYRCCCFLRLCAPCFKCCS